MRKVLIVFCAAMSAVAQTKSGGTTGGSTGVTVPTPTRPPVTSPLPTQQTTPDTQQQQRQNDRVIFLSGKVMMEDGLPIPSSVVIQSVCSTAVHAVAYTDTKGNFNFQWGQRSGVFMDASESGGFRSASSGSSLNGGSGLADPFGTQGMNNCELRASLPGYRSDVVRLATRTSTDNPDVGVIVLHRMANVEGASVSATSLAAPKDAKKAYDHGLQMLTRNKPDDAAKDFEKATTVYPRYADAWVNLGKVRQEQKNPELAKAAYLKALEVDPKLVLPYVELGLMSAGANRWEEANQYLDHGLRLDPVDYPQAWYVSAAANFNLKRFDAAEKSAREALKLDPQHKNPRADYLLGLILAEKKEYSAAAEELRTYMLLVPDSNELPTVKKQLSMLQSLVAQTTVAPQQ